MNRHRFCKPFIPIRLFAQTAKSNSNSETLKYYSSGKENWFSQKVIISKMGRSVLPSNGRVRRDGAWRLFALVVLLLLKQVSAQRGEDIVNVEQSVENPHGDVELCLICHISATGGRNTLRFGKNISQLCRSCHDGRSAASEVHPVDIVPGAEIAEKIPSDFPLENGMLTCLTCHDVARYCTLKQPAALPTRAFLRGESLSRPLKFCFHCHEQKNYQSFNVHNQLETDKVKTDVCLWCHINAPDTGSRLKDAVSFDLRGEASEICGNCHLMPINNSSSDTHTHMYLTPSQEMKWYMFAYEIQPQMRLPFNQLMEYVRAANRAPRSIPLDENGRITCWSCHNPHEEGLLPKWNPRSLGAEPEKATKHRLRAREGDISCRICHQK